VVAFFCDEAVVGVAFLDSIYDDLLTPDVGLGYHFVAVFERGLDEVYFFHCTLACEAGGDDCGFEKLGVISFFKRH